MSRATRTRVPRIPRSVKIGGSSVKISVVRGMEDWGQYDHDERRIRINIRCLDKPGELRSTLRHEIMHAAMAISGVAFMDRFTEECVVRCFDELFFPVWDKLCEKYDL